MRILADTDISYAIWLVFVCPKALVLYTEFLSHSSCTQKMLLYHVYISHSTQQYTCKCISLTDHFSLPSLLVTKWTIKYELWISVNMKLKCSFELLYLHNVLYDKSRPTVCRQQHANARRSTFNIKNEILFLMLNVFKTLTDKHLDKPNLFKQWIDSPSRWGVYQSWAKEEIMSA